MILDEIKPERISWSLWMTRITFAAWTIFVLASFYASMLSFFGGRLTPFIDKLKGLL